MRCSPVFGVLFLILITIHSSFCTTLTIIVKNPDGSPAIGIPVQEVELERYNLSNELAGQTNEEGILSLDFNQNKIWDDSIKRALGLYRYVIMPKEYRWEISDFYYWNSPLEGKDTSLEPIEKYMKEKPYGHALSNWSLGKFIEMKPNDTLEWNITLAKGKTYKVPVRDQFDKPIADASMTINVDLEMHSHTGLGGSIEYKKIKTDKNGLFTIDQINDFIYRFDFEENGYTAPQGEGDYDMLFYQFKEKNNKILFDKITCEEIYLLVRDQKTQKPIGYAEITEGLTTNPVGGSVDLGTTNDKGILRCKKFQKQYADSITIKKETYKDKYIPIYDFTSEKPMIIELEPMAVKDYFNLQSK